VLGRRLTGSTVVPFSLKATHTLPRLLYRF
jgi:hypothetical protein